MSPLPLQARLLRRRAPELRRKAASSVLTDDMKRLVAEQRLGPAMQQAFGEVPPMQPRFIPIHNQDHA